MKYIIQSLLFLVVFIFSAYSRPLPIGSNPQTIKTIVIDAGHGGKDPGALGFGLKEKDITLKIALALKKILNEKLPQIKVVLTRDTDKFIELSKRGEIAQDSKADFFISIHCNSVPKGVKSPHGGAFYILGTNKGQERYNAYIRENEVVIFEDNYKDMYGGFDPKSPEGEIFHSIMKNVFRNESLNLAGKINTEYIKMQRYSYGVKQAPFIVLWQSGVSAVLVETGYISHESEAKYLGSAKGQEEIAGMIYNAINNYIAEIR